VCRFACKEAAKIPLVFVAYFDKEDDLRWGFKLSKAA
jgi:hypothetical protein